MMFYILKSTDMLFLQDALFLLAAVMPVFVHECKLEGVYIGMFTSMFTGLILGVDVGIGS
jgi:hypothetical protein